MAQQRLFVTRQDLARALRRLILSHPDMAETRSRETKTAYLWALDDFRMLWAQRNIQTSKTPLEELQKPRGV